MERPLKKNDLAIVLPLLNCVEYTKQFLPTIKSKYNFNLFIINNGSTDGTSKFLKTLKKKKNYFITQFKENKGVSFAWNLGMRQAITMFDAKYFLIPNNDVLLHPTTIDRLIEAINLPRAVLTSATDYAGRVSTPSDILKTKPPKKLELVEAPDFSCFMLKKETLDKVGFFDEKFFPAYFEDNDFHHRINLAGYRAIKTSRSIYFHFGSRTLKSTPNVKEKLNIGYSNNEAYYIKKWGGKPGEEKYKKPRG